MKKIIGWLILWSVAFGLFICGVLVGGITKVFVIGFAALLIIYLLISTGLELISNDSDDTYTPPF